MNPKRLLPAALSAACFAIGLGASSGPSLPFLFPLNGRTHSEKVESSLGVSRATVLEWRERFLSRLLRRAAQASCGAATWSPNGRCRSSRAPAHAHQLRLLCAAQLRRAIAGPLLAEFSPGTQLGLS